MSIGIVIVWISLMIYLIVVLKAKIIDKKERKWVYLLILAAMGVSLLVALHISLNSITNFLNNSFGRISRLVVDI
ncbi:hypothetical protein [Neobacillus sp. LXY-1]|uniref:hypothetical protein n=1 Tax=Neobacillus sp. LXY-1 TaxID=3379133 RepID=UPI003EE21C44